MIIRLDGQQDLGVAKMKLGIIFNANKLSGKLTHFFTGCYAYHAIWVDDTANVMYDMHWIRRKRTWPHYNPEHVILFDVPKVTAEYLENKLMTDTQWYGILDYCLFLLRPIYHIFGRNTRNANGVICSEMINDDIWNCGGNTQFNPKQEPPSPCDLYNYFKEQ